MRDAISVIIPIYNMADSLEACLKPLIAQADAIHEIILVDDGSTDGTLALCQRLAEQTSCIRLCHQANQGPGMARNLGIAHATGDYALFLDADDYLEPGAIAALRQAVEGGRYDLLVFGYHVRTPKGAPVRDCTYGPREREGEDVRRDYAGHAVEASAWRIQGAPWNKLFSLHTIRAHAIAYPAMRRHEDEVFIERYVAVCSRVRFLPDVLYTHYVNDLRLQWMKYPVNYIDDILSLHADQQRTILTWNPADTATHGLIAKEYADISIRALELSFAPRFGFDRRARLAWMREAAGKLGLRELAPPPGLGRYKAAALRLVQAGRFAALHRLFWLKLQIERSGVLELLKKCT